VRVLLCLTLIVGLSGCSALDRDQAVAVTQQYLVKHHLPLPKGYHVAAQEGYSAGSHAEPLHPVCAIDYTLDGAWLYYFTVEGKELRITEFRDERWINDGRVEY
jgi:hypothetical protein